MIGKADVLLWDGGIDYLRLTAKGGDNDTGVYDVYRKVALAVMASATQGETEQRPWNWQGYNGFTGYGCSYGKSDQGYILQVSGAAATYAASYPIPWDNCPRIDVQLTLWLNGDYPKVANEVAEIANVYRNPRGGKPARPRYINGYGSGDTTYVGSRSSRRYIRVYDKMRESRGDDNYANAWRFEVECKEDLAPTVWEAAPRSGDAATWAANYVYQELRSCGYILPNLAAPLRALATNRIRPKTTSETREIWLREQVAPAIDKMIADGYKADYIRELLGL